MSNSESCIEAIQSLLEDNQRREIKDEWRELFKDPQLSTISTEPIFEQELLNLFEKEVEYGRQKENELRKAKSRRAAKYIRSQMRITPAVGRYIYAVFGWHNSAPGQANHDRLVSTSQAFGFTLDPQEMQLQQLSETKRKEVILEAKNKEWDNEIRLAAITFILGLCYFIWKIISRSSLI